MADDKRSDDPLAGAQYGPKEPRSKMQRLIDTITDADYYGTMQSLGPTGYVMGGLANAVGKASKVAKAAEKTKYAKGGTVSKRADGAAKRGRTVGKIV